MTTWPTSGNILNEALDDGSDSDRKSKDVYTEEASSYLLRVIRGTRKLIIQLRNEFQKVVAMFCAGYAVHASV